jgi:hypothetical protein
MFIWGATARVVYSPNICFKCLVISLTTSDIVELDLDGRKCTYLTYKNKNKKNFNFNQNYTS